MARRIVLGGAEGFRVSRPGYDALSAAFDQYLFHSDYTSLRQLAVYDIDGIGLSNTFVLLPKVFSRPPAFVALRRSGEEPTAGASTAGLKTKTPTIGLDFASAGDPSPDFYAWAFWAGSTTDRIYIGGASAVLRGVVLVFDNLAG